MALWDQVLHFSVLKFKAGMVESCEHLFDTRNRANAEGALLQGFPASVQQAAVIGKPSHQA